MNEGVQDNLVEPARSAARGIWRSFQNAGYASPLYGYTLRGRHPSRLAVVPEDPWPGDPEIGNALFRGEYDFAGQIITAPNEIPWDIAGGTEPWLEALHGFDWLRHFRACDGDAAKRHVQALVRSWLERYGGWHAFTWRPHVLASRIIAWMRHEPLTISSSDLVYRSAVLNSIARQTRHLTRACMSEVGALERLVAITGVVYGGLCLPDGARRLARGLASLNEELAAQVLPDGGLVTRNPSHQLAALQILISLRDTLLRANHEGAVEIQKVIDRMAPMLRFFRHGDGALALFNGGFEEVAGVVTLTLKRAQAKGKAPGQASRSGFQALAAGRTRVLMDAGAPPPVEFSARAHAGVLSFEMSVGKERLIVNCGSVEAANAGPSWDRVSRSTAAHSVLIVDNRNSCAIMENGRIGTRPDSVTVDREEAVESVWVDASHNGYGRTYGLVCQRRLYLDAGGGDLRGEDIVTGPGVERNAGLPFDIRFHIHPKVTCSIVQNGESVLLRTPRGGGWRFHARGGEISLDESVYLGRHGESRRCEQIVVACKIGAGDNKVNWSLKRIDSGA